MNKSVKLIAFYLPQYHPLKENDKWWGSGFTEWTNVAKAKPLFKGHYQPNIPADLGFYDLRLPESREQQAKLAKEAGISCFCYWHYWFGNGKRLLEMPFNEVLKSGKPDFPFCLAWANHSWLRKSWNSDTSWFNKELLIEQTYPGEEDFINHFYFVLDAFKDKRYMYINDKPIFVIFKPDSLPNPSKFIQLWNKLANENELNGIHFVAHTVKEKDINKYLGWGFNAINLSLHLKPFNNKSSLANKAKRLIKNGFLKIPNLVEYSEAIKIFNNPYNEEEYVYPTIIPNWDHSPRSGIKGRIIINSTPLKFDRHVKTIFKSIKHKKNEQKVVFIKSWNEWGEGNYLEPDLKYGKKYLEVLRRNIDDFN